MVMSRENEEALGSVWCMVRRRFLTPIQGKRVRGYLLRGWRWVGLALNGSWRAVVDDESRGIRVGVERDGEVVVLRKGRA
jgi:hypothetical protein